MKSPIICQILVNAKDLYTNIGPKYYLKIGGISGVLSVGYNS